ncbi:DUF6049 family protein [Microcella sp.]|uniref:DUF6049 family protein n=1 Tax=Microcella sp. TaxID=1913979 RepID=UPI00391C5A2E
MSVERERAPRPALLTLARAGAAAAIATALAMAPLPVIEPGGAARAATTDAPAEVAIDLLAAPSATGIVRAGDDLSVRVTVTNAGEQPTGAISVALGLDAARSATAAELAAWFDGVTVASSDQRVATASLSSLDPGASAVLDLIVPAERAALSGPFGARLAVVRATIDDEVAAVDRTAVVWVPSATTVPEAATTFVAAISTPGESAAFLDADALAAYTAEAGALTRTLDAVAGRPVLLAIDPRIIASIRRLGADAPATATAFLERLSNAPNESFVLPWADADPIATIAAQGVPLPETEGTGVVDATTANVEGASPSPSPEPGPTVTLDELTAWPATLDGWNWLDHGALSADGLPVLAEAGTRVLVAPAAALGSAAAVQRGGEITLVRTDDALAASARDASLAVSQQRFDRSMARVSSLLAATASAEPGIPTLIALSRGQLAGTDRLIDTIAQTVALPWARGAEASAALSRPAAEAVVGAAGADDARAQAVRSALEAEAADRVFAGIAVTPAAITDIRRLELLAALSQGWGERSTEALRGFTSDSIALRSSVQVVESSAITLLADRASLPVTVQNDLDVAVRVFVRVEPDTAQLRVVDPRVETLVEPQSQTRALVPVESLTNGQVDIAVSVRDAEARVIGTPTRVSLNLQAGWETAGTIAVAIALLALLIAGIVRDVRKRRRRAQSDDAVVEAQDAP